MSIEHEIYRAVYIACMQTGHDSYDYLPPDTVSYPFIYVGEQFGNGIRDNKDKRTDRIHQTVHVYHDNYDQRGTFAKIMGDVKNSVLAIRGVGGRRVVIEDDSTRVLSDQSTNIKLMHGVVEFTFRIL